jgi:hypothetical protein
MFSAPFYFVVLVDTLATKLAIATITFVLVVITVERIVIPFWSNYLIIDETGMRGVVKSTMVDIRWEDVKAVWQPEASSVHQSITLSTTHGIKQIYIRHFDRKGIWKAVRSYVKSEAFESITYRTLPEYRRLSTNLTKLFSLYEFPLRSNQYPARAVEYLAMTARAAKNRAARTSTIQSRVLLSTGIPGFISSPNLYYYRFLGHSRFVEHSK